MATKTAAEAAEEALRMRVYQGLQKRRQCGLCEQEFFVSELPGAITYKSIMDLRERWRRDNAGSREFAHQNPHSRDTSPQGRPGEKGSALYTRLYKVKPAPGVDPSRPSPSRLYKRVELCIFCMQFFDVDGTTQNTSIAGGGAAADGSADHHSGRGQSPHRFNATGNSRH